MLRECDEICCRRGSDHDPEAFSRLVTRYRPMVASICRRYVIEPADVEDAVQETFVKLSRRADEVTGDVGAWLAAVAGTTALDYARRSLRERARRKQLALEDGKQDPTIASWRVLEMRLQEALEGLDPTMRSLVLARYFTGEAVKQLAKRSGVNSATMSRRVAKAVARIRRALEAKGFGSVEEILRSDELDVAPRGKNARAARPGSKGEAINTTDNRIRVGVLLSHQTTQLEMNPMSSLFHEGETHQLKPILAFAGSKYQLIAILEPGTEEYGYLENDTREYGVIGGVVTATDVEALKTLDVIVLGHAYAVTTRLIDAVTEAVESGVGLYHEGHLGTEFPGVRDPKLCKLMMTDRMSLYHTPGAHNLPRAATVVAAHPILAGVAVGTGLQIAGCGPAFVPRVSEAKVLMVRDEAVDPQDPPMPELNGLKTPALVVGKLGRGRVVMVGMRFTKPVQALPGLRGKFEHNIFDWLAEERLSERRLWTGSSAV